MINWVPNKSVNTHYINQCISKCEETNVFTNGGQFVKQLEKETANLLKIDTQNKAIIVVVNASVGLQILTSSLSYYYNKKIKWATQSFTFPPSAQGTLSKAKILDIDLECGLDLSKVDLDSIDGIIVTNIFGNCVDIKKYTEWSKKYKKYLIFDNAATPFTFYQDSNVNNYGHGSVISFHHTKPLGFGEGGAIIVDKQYEVYIRKLINFGINLTDEYFTREGINGKMSEISAIYILSYLKNNFNNIIEKHQHLYNYLQIRLSDLNLKEKGINLFPSFHTNNKYFPSCFCLLIDNFSEEIINKFNEKQIFCRKYYEPLKSTHNTMKIYNKILCLPCTKDMTLNDVDNILNVLTTL